MQKRKLLGESLEARKLLAGDVCEVFLPEGESVVTFDHSSASLRESDHDFALSFPIVWHPASMLRSGDRLADVGDQVFAIRDNVHDYDVPWGTDPVTGEPRDEEGIGTDELFVFDRAADGSLALRESLALELHVAELVVTDENVVLFGSTPSRYFEPVTKVVTLNRADMAPLSETELDGEFVSVVRNDADRLYVSTQPNLYYITDIHSPSHRDINVSVLELGDDGAQFVAHGMTHAAVRAENLVPDGFVLVETTNVYHQDEFDETGIHPQVVPSGTKTELVRYAVEGDELVAAETLELGSNLRVQLQISKDRSTAVLFQESSLGYWYHWDGVVPREQSLIIVDLDDGRLSQFEKIRLGETVEYRPISFALANQTALVERDGNVVVVVDLNKEIDLSAEGRVSRMELPGTENRDISGIHPGVEPGLFHIVRGDYARYGFEPSLTEILTVSATEGVLGTADFIGQTRGELLPIDAANQRYAFHLVSFGDLNQHASQEYVFGAFDEDGRFVEEGRIEAANWLEPEITPTRLILRGRDQLTSYRWEDPGSPTIIPLGDPLRSVTAVDDVFEVVTTGPERRFDLTANDEVALHHYPWTIARVIELVEAPDGVTLDRNHVVLSEDAMRSPENLRFDYVLEYAGQRSTASVEIKKLTFTETDVEAAIERTILDLADRFESETEIEVIRSRTFVERPMQGNVDGDRNPLRGRYGVVVELAAEGTIYRYAADFAGEVALIGEQSSAPKIAIDLRAVDADGNPIERIEIGDEFFLEVSTQDLRNFGKGVFGIAFDLQLPAELLELTGEIRELGKFQSTGGEINDNGLDDWTAIDVRFTPPGSDVQPALRIGVRSVAAGTVQLELDAAESRGAELLLHGIDEAISVLRAEFGSLNLTVGTEPLPEDTDGNGRVTPRDALRVINFVSAHGSMSVTDLSTVAEAEEVALLAMKRLDANLDGSITVRDALKVINHLAANDPIVAPTGEVEQLSDFLDSDDKDREIASLI